MADLDAIHLAAETGSPLEKVEALLRLANEVMGSNPQQAKEAAEKALTFVNTFAEAQPKRAQVLLTLGTINRRISDFENALHQLLESLALLESPALLASDGVREKLSQALSGLGLLYEKLADYPTALSYCQRSLRTSEENEDRRGVAASLNHIGILYYHLMDYPNALTHFEKSLASFESLGHPIGVASSLNGIGSVYLLLNDYPNAADYFQRSLDRSRQAGDRQTEAAILTNLGEVALKTGDTDAALGRYTDSLLLCQADGNRAGEASARWGLASALIKLSRYAEAETHLNIALEFYKALGVKEGRYETLELLSTLYTATKDFEKAHHFYTEFHKAKEEVFSAENVRKLQNMQVVFIVEQSKKDAELQRKEAELARLRNVELAKALSEAERQRQRAEAANALKSEFLGIAAHDLKNPLQSIMGFAQLLQEKSGTPRLVQEYSAVIESSSNRMLGIITDLLLTVQTDTTELELHLEEINLGELLHFVVQNNFSQAERKQQTFITDIAPDCYTHIDSHRMKEVLDNLVSNAVKYSPRGKKITVSCQRLSLSQEPSANRVQLSVKDDGLGMTAEDLEKVFGKFQRLSARPTGGESSTGLGLSIVKQLVELHGGKVWAESAGKDKGTTFFVELPAATDSPL